jgi:acetyl-CoA carboxylase carboxyl transferase subunit beta
MAWFLRSKQNISENQQKEMPDGLWTKCPNCSEIIFKKQLEDNLFTCSSCEHHFRIGTNEYIKILLDEDSFIETNTKIYSTDPLNFTDTKNYTDRLNANYSKTGLNEALTTGYGTIYSKNISFASMNFNFIGGSMGSVVGEKFCRAAKYAIDKKIPYILVAASGGARMQEAALSLMQMAKTSAMIAIMGEEKIPFVTILTDPTTGGVTASFGMLGDISIAEPEALIGFAGPRVIEQTIRKKLPQGFQRAESLLEHGFIDMIVHRKEMKDSIFKIINWFS